VSGGQCGSDKDGVQSCPSGEYCQPWNPNFYQCRSIDTATCGQQEVGIDFNGDDIATVEASLPELCCDKCRKTQGCKAYTFVNYNADGRPRCYLKSGSGTKQKLVGAVSAVVSAPACTVPSAGQCGSDKDGVSCCPSGEYCQPWNPFFYQCRPSPKQCAAQEVGVDYVGDDMKTIESILPWECCDRCAETAGCKAYTFVNYNSNGKSACYLKSGTGKKQAKVGAVSSTVVSPRL
jgi:glucan 1,3-beta-glucosidase